MKAAAGATADGRGQVRGWHGVGAAVLAGCVLAARRWQLRWGATSQEAGGLLPGDDLIADPDLTATRAITIGVPAGQVCVPRRSF